uniref:Uncharacterized protein n=1 Tax=Pavo cristatus TaxID=9049 RepID=A0A8C9G787_PAVCR
MVFWSFVAGVVTFYCSLGPDSLLPNILYTIKYKPKVNTCSSLRLVAVHVDGNSCAVLLLKNIRRPSSMFHNLKLDRIFFGDWWKVTSTFHFLACEEICVPQITCVHLQYPG